MQSNTSAFHDNNVEEVISHISYARETHQIPEYYDKTNPRSQIRWIVATDNGIAIIPEGGNSSGDTLSGYEFEPSKIEEAITRNISNYNIHYFDSIDDIAEFVSRNKITPQKPSSLPGQLRWTYAHRAEGSAEVIIYPEDPSPILFRGQNKRYQPCNPTISRDLSSNPRDVISLTHAEQASLILNFIRTQWFVEHLRETPMFQWMKANGVFMDETAVAQHYGMPTGYIDLTQSFDIASFFACCKFENKEWTPVTSGEGVIYILDQRRIPPGHGPKLIGLQPFPRPCEQWGWVHEVTLGDDFDSLPYVKKFIFRHDKKSSRRIFEKCQLGRALFPPDELATVAYKIMQAKEVPLNVACRTIEGLINDPLGLPGNTEEDILDMIAMELQVAAVDTPPIVVTDEIRTKMRVSWEQRKGSFFEGIGFRLTRTDVKNTPNLD